MKSHFDATVIIILLYNYYRICFELTALDVAESALPTKDIV